MSTHAPATTTAPERDVGADTTPALVQPAELHRFSIEEYHRLVACGGFDDELRVELIDGLLVDTARKSPEHENAIAWLLDWLMDHLDRTRYQLRVAASVTIRASEPEPDLVIVERAPPKLEHPTQAPLVIEVALSSTRRDLGVKPAVYADAVAEYWVVDLERRCVIVHRDPAARAYRDVSVVPAGEDLSARSVDLGRLPTGELFATAFAEHQSHAPQR
jgi:Uma2 family endonuclease